MNALLEVRRINDHLNTFTGKEWAYWFVQHRMDFHRKCCMGYLFSTSFGASFFKDVEHYLTSNALLEPDKGQTLGEYDKNFNAWLKVNRIQV